MTMPSFDWIDLFLGRCLVVTLILGFVLLVIARKE